MRLVVSGSRTWTDEVKLNRELLAYVAAYGSQLTVLCGMASRGADALAVQFLRSVGVELVEFPADWSRLGKAAGVLRNAAMLDADADELIAFRAEGDSRGTDHIVAEARKRNVPVRVVRP